MKSRLKNSGNKNIIQWSKIKKQCGSILFFIFTSFNLVVDKSTWSIETNSIEPSVLSATLRSERIARDPR